MLLFAWGSLPCLTSVGVAFVDLQFKDENRAWKFCRVAFVAFKALGCRSRKVFLKKSLYWGEKKLLYMPSSLHHASLSGVWFCIMVCSHFASAGRGGLQIL